MKKDIFIDANIAKSFANPADPEYIKLLEWLRTYNRNPRRDAYLVVSKKLLQEYIGSTGDCINTTNICAIVGVLLSEGRLIVKKNKDISDFRKTHYKKHIRKCLTCNRIDRDYHIPTVLLSDRRYALSIDSDFIRDLIWFPGFTVVTAKRPQAINYT